MFPKTVLWRAISAALMMIILSGCVSTTRNITGIHGAFFANNSVNKKVTYHGKMAEFEAHFRMAIAEPERANLIIFLHGTDGSGVGQECKPLKRSPPIIVTLLDSIPNTVSYYHCANVISGGNSGKSSQLSDAFLRSGEVAELIERFHGLGIDYKRIFLMGNSGGASTSLYVALKHPEKIGGFIASAPGYGYGYIDGDEYDLRLRPHYNVWKSNLSGITNSNGLVYAYKNDKYSPPKQMNFLKEIDGIEMKYVANASCNGWDPHAYLYSKCFIREQEHAVVKFIEKQLKKAGIENTERNNTTAAISNEIRNLSDENICSGAIQQENGQIGWDTRKPYWDIVSEAKNRNLTPELCANILNRETSTLSEPSSLPGNTFRDLKVCAQAIRRNGSQIVWETSSSFKSIVDEAKRRNLTIEDCTKMLEWNT